ncbi:MAG TPA: DUF427 domain-containing protein [Jatrophihabitantaceae bacterium]|jgi:uncharacterized protein (DUF427 family)|nr:DUF427 domain-containing protein [Jatrophihabitantaceae bacterium]
MTRERKFPGPDHPITVEPTPARVVVRVAGRVLADTDKALTLREASYPAVQYVPLAAIDQDAIRHTDTHTYCPYKGDASYYTIATADGELTDAIWTYEQPYDAVADIAGHAAFYPDQVEITVGE